MPKVAQFFADAFVRLGEGGRELLEKRLRVLTDLLRGMVVLRSKVSFDAQRLADIAYPRKSR
jgi:hypothetical protein